MRPRDERGHPVVKDALDKGYLGTGQPYVVRGLATHEAAEQARKCINSAARHLGVSCSSRQGEDVIAEPDGTYTVQFKLFSKSSAREHIVRQSGGDPTKLAYNPFARAEGPLYAPDGTRLNS
jgi:hypothetical protein